MSVLVFPAKPVLPAPIEGIAVAAPARPEAHNIVGGFTVVVPKAEQTPRAEQSVLTESDVKVDKTMGVLVIPEPVLQTEADIETQAEADVQLESNTHKPQRPVSVMNAPVEFTSESLLTAELGGLYDQEEIVEFTSESLLT